MPEAKDITILVVDDEKDLRKALVFDFKRQGFNVLDAGSGNEAFEIIKNNNVHIVLSDVRMPNGDGVELLDRIKEISPEIPVVMFITGFADISFEDAYNRGAHAIFAKPFDRKEILSAVRNALKSKDEVWSARKFERVETNFSIELIFQQFTTAIKGRVLNIGRGGMFVAFPGNLPNVDEKAEFLINFEGGDLKTISGQGIVRWTRRETQANLPAGLGIEFLFLMDNCRAHIIEYIDSQKKLKSFIPKN